jgi:hypothetical protein
MMILSQAFYLLIRKLFRGSRGRGRGGEGLRGRRY